jgi:hypothetical protein
MVIYVSLSQYVELVVSRPSLETWRLTLAVRWASRTQSPLWPLLLSVQVYQVRQLGFPAVSNIGWQELFSCSLEMEWKIESGFTLESYRDFNSVFIYTLSNAIFITILEN